jgi:dTDP-L-oleandrosyltransferase
LANRWNIPAVQTSPEFAFDKNQFDHQVQHSEFRKFILEMAEPFDTFLERYGIASNGGLFHRERLNVYFFAETFQPCKDTCDDSCFYASRCPAEQPYVGDWSVQNSGGRPVALVSASTCFIRGPDYYKMCIEALAGQQWHVVLCIGDHVDPSTLKPLPPHFEVVQGISQNRILPHASLFIFSGGMISTTEAAYHGVPLIAVTNGGLELEWLADSTLVRHAIGLHLRKSETNVESLRQAAIQVAADVKIRDRIKRLQRAIKQAPGGEETANRIEYYLETQNS